MKTFDFATATRLDLEIWDTQEKNKIYQIANKKSAKMLHLGNNN